MLPQKFFVDGQMEKYFPDNSLLRLWPNKSSISMSKSVSLSLDNSDIPSNNEPSPYRSVVSLKYPKKTWKTTIQKTLNYENNRQKSLYTTVENWLCEQHNFNAYIFLYTTIVT